MFLEMVVRLKQSSNFVNFIERDIKSDITTPSMSINSFNAWQTDKHKIDLLIDNLIISTNKVIIKKVLKYFRMFNYSVYLPISFNLLIEYINWVWVRFSWLYLVLIGFNWIFIFNLIIMSSRNIFIFMFMTYSQYIWGRRSTFFLP